MSKADRDNRSNQLNQNNDAFYQSRGYDARPDNDNDDECCGYRGRTFSSSPPPSSQSYFLENHSALVRRTAAAERIKHPGLDLCDFLMRNHPYFAYKHTGWHTAVIVHVLGCDIDSEEAAIINILASTWRESSAHRDALTVFQIEFHTATKDEQQVIEK